MRKKNYKGRCEKKQIAKCAGVCRTYDDIQRVYAERLAEREDIAEIRCNVSLDGLSLGDYTSDFVCLKSDGELMVRECIYRRLLNKPMTLKLLDTRMEP